MAGSTSEHCTFASWSESQASLSSRARAPGLLSGAQAFLVCGGCARPPVSLGLAGDCPRMARSPSCAICWCAVSGAHARADSFSRHPAPLSALRNACPPEAGAAEQLAEEQTARRQSMDALVAVAISAALLKDRQGRGDACAAAPPCMPAVACRWRCLPVWAAERSLSDHSCG